jgi:uncharacterized protein
MEIAKAQNRIIEIDILRGVAVFGMILWDFKSRSMGNYYCTGYINNVVCNLIAVSDIENTVHLAFAFLFGWGLSMQIRLNFRWNKIRDIYLRRLLSLFMIGLVNCFFIDRTDILHIFAAFGLIFILFANRSNRMVLTSAIILIGIPVVGRFILSRIMSPDNYYDPGSYDSLKAHIVIFSNYSDLVLLRAHEFVREYGHPHSYLRNLDIFVMILFGHYAARRGIFQNVSSNIGYIRKILWFSLAVRLIGSGWIFTIQHRQSIGNDWSEWAVNVFYLISLNNRLDTVQTLVKLYSDQALTLFYICMIVLLLQGNMWKRLCMPFANVGQLALSNYLLHSLIGTSLFFGYGLSLYGKLGCAQGEGLALFIFGLQMLFSRWWMRKFSFGPVEWLWRSVTYWKILPFRVPKARS